MNRRELFKGTLGLIGLGVLGKGNGTPAARYEPKLTPFIIALQSPKDLIINTTSITRGSTVSIAAQSMLNAYDLQVNSLVKVITNE